ncbi:MAG: (Fe-S)-binding protein [Nitrososphaeria archaeon]
MITEALCYPEYFNLPRSYMMLAVYLSASLSVVFFFWLLEIRLKNDDVSLREFLTLIFKKYKGWASYLSDVLTHRRLLKDRKTGGISHFFMVYALLLSFIGTLLVAFNQYYEIITGSAIFCGYFFESYSFIMDVVMWVLFASSIGGLVAIYMRRYIVPKRDIVFNSFYLLGFAYLAITGALLESFRINSLGISSYYFFNVMIFNFIKMSYPEYLGIYLTHFELAFILIALIPETSVFHSLLSLTNYLKEERSSGELRKPFDLKEIMEKGTFDVQVGINKTSDIKGFDRLELEACMHCYRCQDVCPAYAAGRPLSPTQLITDLKNGINKDKNIWDFIQEDTIWSCTTCGACVEACPVYIRHTDYIVDSRRALVMNMKLDEKKNTLLLSLSSQENALGLPNQERNSWLSEEGIKKASEVNSVENLLWVGCMGSFDPEARDIVKNFVEVLKKAGIQGDYAYLGEEETCCGDPARRLGEESKFQDLALKNIEIFKKYNVKNIITICPHGYNTFKNEYPKIDPWIKSVKVKHYSEVIQELLEKEKIKVKKSEEVLTIHDPCYLSRHNGITEPQRLVLKKVGNVKEPAHSGKDTFCCGAGGSNYWYEVKESEKISHLRFKELKDTGASTVVVLCPFCNAMLNDASTVLSDGKIKIKDIAEVVKDSLT